MTQRKICRNAAEWRRKGVRVCTCQDRDKSLAQTMLFLFHFFPSVALNSSSSPLHPRCQTDVKIPQSSNLNHGLWFIYWDGETNAGDCYGDCCLQRQHGRYQSWAKIREHPWACREAPCCYCPASVGDRTERVRFWLQLGAIKPTGVFLCFHQSKEMRNCVLSFYLFLYFLSLPTHPVDNFTQCKNT